MPDIITVSSSGKRYINGVLQKRQMLVGVPIEITPDKETIREEEAYVKATTVDVGKQEQPTKKELIKSVAEASKQIISSGFKLVTDKIQSDRLDICLACNHLNKNMRCVHLRFEDGTVERGCGCYMPIKSKLAAMKCPQGKW